MHVDRVEGLMAPMGSNALTQLDSMDGSSARTSPIAGICVGLLISLPVWAGIVVALR